MTWRSGQALVSRQQWRIEQLCQRDIDGVISREVVSQAPHARQKEIVRVAMQWQIGKIGERCLAAFLTEIAARSVTPEHLRNFHIEQMRCVQRFAWIE